jgi:alkaline phosphatase
VRKILTILTILSLFLTLTAFTDTGDVEPTYVILMIADGWGYKHIEAGEKYSGNKALYEDWTHYALATWDMDTLFYNDYIGYDPESAWTEFEYVTDAFTDSASAATAMFTGLKTDRGNICIGPDDSLKLMNINDYAKEMGLSSGAVSSVYLSHATPGAWFAHNSSRKNGFAIFDEGVWGNPNYTGEGEGYGGGYGISEYLPDVMIGAGHPNWNTDYINPEQLTILRDELTTHSGWALVERTDDGTNAGQHLAKVSRNPDTDRLIGLFGGEYGCFPLCLADRSGYTTSNPTLAECTISAINVLQRNPEGFVLMIEGGAIDWVCHGGNMNGMLGELFDFNKAVEEVVYWVEDTDNTSNWSNTLLIVTGDHECGYLTAGVGVFPDKELGEVSERTIQFEKVNKETQLRASWEDIDGDNIIDTGEEVYWAWNSGDHTNSLIPLFAKGKGVEFFGSYKERVDPVRGPYIDNTNIFDVMITMMSSSGIYLKEKGCFIDTAEE